MAAGIIEGSVSGATAFCALVVLAILCFIRRQKKKYDDAAKPRCEAVIVLCATDSSSGAHPAPAPPPIAVDAAAAVNALFEQPFASQSSPCPSDDAGALEIHSPSDVVSSIVCPPMQFVERCGGGGGGGAGPPPGHVSRR